MKLEKILQNKLDRLEEIPEKFSSDTDKAQKKIFRSIIALISDIDTSKGNIKQTKANIKKVNSIVNKLKGIITKSQYVNIVRDFSKQFATQAGLNNAYFLSVFDTKPSDFAKEFLKQQKIIVIDSLIGSTAIDQVMQKPFRKILINAVSSNANIVDLTNQVSDFILGSDGRLGNLHRYSKQIATDAFTQTDAAYVKTLSDEAGATWFLYQGGKVQDTRKFCRVRDSKYFHVKEVKDWGNIPTWQGRMSGTDSSSIWTDRGGYNCKHAIMPQSVFSVPKRVLIRNMASGNYKPSDKEKTLLGI